MALVWDGTETIPSQGYIERPNRLGQTKIFDISADICILIFSLPTFGQPPERR
jgi:hypothetical protein